MQANFNRMKSGYDVRFRLSSRLKRATYAVLGAVALNPDFFIEDVYMNKTKMDPTNLCFPSDCHHELAIIRFVKNFLMKHFKVGIVEVCNFRQDFTNNVAVMG